MGHSTLDGNWVKFVKRLGINAARYFVNPIMNVTSWTVAGNCPWGNDLNNNSVSSLATFLGAVSQLRTANGRNWTYPWANPFKWSALYQLLTNNTIPVYGIKLFNCFENYISLSFENLALICL